MSENIEDHLDEESYRRILYGPLINGDKCPPPIITHVDPIFQEMLAELIAIRRLLEWDKADTLERRAQAEAEEESNKAEFMATQRELMEVAAKRSLEIQRQAYEEHERLYHKPLQTKGQATN